MTYRIVFDLDDVLCNLREPMSDALAKATGKRIAWQDWTTYDLPVLYGVGLDHCLSAFLEHEVLERAKPEPGAVDAVRVCRELGCEVQVMTARGWHPDGDALTRSWLAAHGFVVDALAVVGLHESKAAVIEAAGGADFLLDDSPRHIQEVMATGVVTTPVVLCRPWNQHVTGAGRVRGNIEFCKLVMGRMAARCFGSRNSTGPRR